MKANLHQLTHVQMNDVYFMLYLLQLFDFGEWYLQNVNIGNLPYPSTSQTLWFHKPCHPTQREQMYLHGGQQEITVSSLYENLVHVR